MAVDNGDDCEYKLLLLRAINNGYALKISIKKEQLYFVNTGKVENYNFIIIIIIIICLILEILKDILQGMYVGWSYKW